MIVRTKVAIYTSCHYHCCVYTTCRDVIVRAVTGSGKTLAFAVPIIHILSNRQACMQSEKFSPKILLIRAWWHGKVLLVTTRMAWLLSSHTLQKLCDSGGSASCLSISCMCTHTQFAVRIFCEYGIATSLLCPCFTVVFNKAVQNTSYRLSTYDG